MIIRDTMTGGGRELGPGRVRIYLCGVTTYDDSHVGHARTVIVFDVLRRFLEGGGSAVELVQNFTDIDDKIIARAGSEGVPASEISARYEASYLADSDALNVLRASRYPRATDHVGDIVSFISGLVKKGAAYETATGVYFAVSGFPGYGRLSGKNPDELRAGARVAVDESKRDPLDFALWKRTDGGPSWESPWGRGRPGWHIECSAMCARYLGETFELHGGGRDLIFPHHENEIAQSEARSGAPLAGAWMHVGMVTISGEKMSKSLGNVRSIRRALAEWGPNVVRIFCLSGHYSKPIDYAEDIMRGCLARWRQAEACHYELMHATGGGAAGGAAAEARRLGGAFDSALGSDMNTHLALDAFFDLARAVNRAAAGGTLGGGDAAAITPEFCRMAGVLGLRIPAVGDAERGTIESLIAEREALRAKKMFGEADGVRDRLAAMGVELLDHGGRTVWVKRERAGADPPAPGG